MPGIFHKISFHSRRSFKKIKTSFWALTKHPWKIVTYIFLRSKGVDTKYGYVTIYGFPEIYKYKNSKIILGKGCVLVSKSKYNYAGINHRVVLATLSPDAVIKIGRVGISGSSICAAKYVSMDDYSGLGANSNIYDTDFHPLDPVIRMNQTNITQAKCGSVVIGREVWIASNVTILKGVTIGDQAVVGAGAIVTSSIPARTVYAGNPAKKIREL